MKIVPLKRLEKVCAVWKAEGRTIAMAHGCFDYLHIGHARYLAEAAAMADILVVTVTADQYVKKGKGRPVFDAHERAEMLAALECVDYVAINDAPTAVPALRLVKPTLYVKGCDYQDVGCFEFDEAFGLGIKMRFAQSEKFSSTELIKRIKKCR